MNEMGIEAKGFAADITNKMQLIAEFQQIRNTFDTIDVVEFSPHNGNVPVTPVLETTVESALLFTSELSAMIPSSMFGNSGIAMSGLRNYILNLHERLLPHGVFVGHMSISPLIKKDTGFDPDQVAEAWYDLYERRTQAEETFPKGIKQLLK